MAKQIIKVSGLKHKDVFFSELSINQFFIYQGGLYIKTSKTSGVNAIRFSDNKSDSFPGNVKIDFVPKGVNLEVIL